VETQKQDMTFQTVDIDQGKQLIDENDVIIVDIRDSMAYGSAHIQNAQHINDSNVEGFVEAANKSQPLLVYCYHGHTSRVAAEYFVKSGFSDVYSLDGGFESWRCKYPVIGCD
jgi:thiosulfate sulfurtransferase